MKASLTVAAAALLLAACSSSGATSPPSTSREDPGHLARSLRLCESPQVDGALASCTYPDGIVTLIALAPADRARAAADAATSPRCVLLAPDWQVTGDRAVLDAHVDVSQLQADGARLAGSC